MIVAAVCVAWFLTTMFLFWAVYKAQRAMEEELLEIINAWVKYCEDTQYRVTRLEAEMATLRDVDDLK